MKYPGFYILYISFSMYYRKYKFYPPIFCSTAVKFLPDFQTLTPRIKTDFTAGLLPAVNQSGR